MTNKEINRQTKQKRQLYLTSIHTRFNGGISLHDRFNARCSSRNVKPQVVVHVSDTSMTFKQVKVIKPGMNR